MRLPSILVICLLTSFYLQGQVIKGIVTDRLTELPLIGANLVLTSVDPPLGTVSDQDGRFNLAGVLPGRHNLQITYLGYDPINLPNILVTSGKDVVLEVGLEEALIKMDEVVVSASVEKDKPGNEMATISSRMFTLEEVTRYSGGRNDASRMAANFAGVNIADDSRNDIVIRGNSPTGVLWRMEGIPIPNPNHFATLGTTGGPVSALNTNLLKNSDFMTSAFPAEYGNANAGVFDIQLRSGNRDKFEFTGQLAAFSGLEFMAEGPISKERGSSFVASYRHSFVELAHAAGLNVGTAATPNYKDLTFKIDLGRTKTGKWSVFGLGATSDIDFLAEDVEDDDFFAEQDEDSYATSLIGLLGINHSILLNNRSYIKTTVGFSTSGNTFDVDEYAEGLTEKDRVFEIDDQNTRISLSSFLNTKIDAGLNIRSGILYERFSLNAFSRDKDDGIWRTVRNFNDHLQLFQAYTQTQWKPNRHLTLNAGLHVQYLDLNSDFAIEPRAAINWHLDGGQQINLGFGIHNQMLPLPIYIFETGLPDGTFSRTNVDASFLKSAHCVLGYDKRLGNDWRLKTEVYYQDLIDVPVEQEISSFSILNVGADFGFPEVGFLQNTGSGANYGAELTIEKFFSSNYYLLTTGSLFQSKYTGSDGIERNTAFNNNYIYNILGGKEFLFSKEKQNAITFDFKFTVAGGRYYTPIDLETSIRENREVRFEEKAYSERFDPYLRLDLKFGYRLNNSEKGISQQFFLDFQNITNRENVFVRRYNTSTKRVDTIYQIGFFPDVLYRIQF
ncbi:MAG: TonB-dependent receptor [Saprospiraceae bacterium]|nr:TonB-dependent receptor [Saprospiraceae bacterium]